MEYYGVAYRGPAVVHRRFVEGYDRVYKGKTIHVKGYYAKGDAAQNDIMIRRGDEQDHDFTHPIRNRGMQVTNNPYRQRKVDNERTRLNEGRTLRGRIVSTAKDAYGWARDRVSDVSRNANRMYNVASSKVKEIIGVVNDFAQNSQFAQDVRSAYNRGKQVVSGAINTIRETATSIFAQARDLVVGAYGSAKKAVTGAYGAAKNAATGAYGTVKTAATNAYNAVRGFVTSGINWIKGLFNPSK